jgi:hypothetical protein
VTHFRSGLYPIYLYAPKAVQRALAIPCPICREQSGRPCKIDEGKPIVHDARESIAFHGKKIWT